jgi:iron uptake system EfeUOB component EfeO/EfeM
VRRALFVVLLLAGCGGSSQAPAPRDKVAPPPTREVEVQRIRGTDMTPQEIADAASGVPVNGFARPEHMPVPSKAFDVPIARYRAYSGRQARAMAREVDALQRALSAGDRAAARRAWAGAYERYLFIGAAYGALGDLDARIVHTRMRIERGLWTGDSLRTLRAPAADLARDVRTLRRVVPRVEITPLDYAIRAHEILEDAQRDMLSGVAAPYSGAGVRATAASLNATYAVIKTLHTLLATRGEIAPVETSLLGLRRELDAIRRAHGGQWPVLDALTRREHQRLNARLGAGLERLAYVPHTLETQYAPAVPELRP